MLGSNIKEPVVADNSKSNSKPEVTLPPKSLAANDNCPKSPEKKEKSLSTYVDECLDRVFGLNDFFSLMEAVNSEDRFKQHYGIIGLRKILSVAGNPPIQAVIDANLIPRLINFMDRKNEPRLQYEATWALTNIASGTSQQIQSILDAGGLPVLINLLKLRRQDLAEQALWAIGNIAGDSAMCRDLVLKNGGLEPLVSIVHTAQNEATIKVGVWAISNLCRGRPLPNFDLVQKAIPTLSKVIQENEDEETLTDALWAMSYLSDNSDMKATKVVQTNIIPSLVKRIDGNNRLSLLIPALRTIGNILTSNEELTNMVLDVPGAVDKIFVLLHHEKKAVRREACWAISGLAAGTPTQIEFITKDLNRIVKLIDILNSDHQDVKKEAGWVLRDLTSHANPEQMGKLCQFGLLNTFCSMLKSPDQKILELALEAINNILNYGTTVGCQTGTYVNPFAQELDENNQVELIEELQTHPSDEVYLKALKILENHFVLEELVDN